MAAVTGTPLLNPIRPPGGRPGRIRAGEVFCWKTGPAVGFWTFAPPPDATLPRGGGVILTLAGYVFWRNATAGTGFRTGAPGLDAMRPRGGSGVLARIGEVAG